MVLLLGSTQLIPWDRRAPCTQRVGARARAWLRVGVRVEGNGGSLGSHGCDDDAPRRIMRARTIAARSFWHNIDGTECMHHVRA
eukprot:4011430-Pleurochrysis_carterae.AAC.1